MNGLGSLSEQKAKYVMVYKLFLTPSPCCAPAVEKAKIKRGACGAGKIERPGRQMTGRKK